MPHYLYRIEPTRPAMLADGPTAQEAEAVAAHFDYLRAHAERGVLFMAGRTLPAHGSSFGLALFSAPSDAAAQAFLDEDPALQRGVMKGEVFPFRVALWAGDPLAPCDAD